MNDFRATEQQACYGIPVDMFYPDKYTDVQAVRSATNICRGCPLQLPCLDHALNTPSFDDHGIWGGTTPNQRARIRKNRSQAAAPVTEGEAA